MSSSGAVGRDDSQRTLTDFTHSIPSVRITLPFVRGQLRCHKSLSSQSQSYHSPQECAILSWSNTGVKFLLEKPRFHSLRLWASKASKAPNVNLTSRISFFEYVMIASLASSSHRNWFPAPKVTARWFRSAVDVEPMFSYRAHAQALYARQPCLGRLLSFRFSILGGRSQENMRDGSAEPLPLRLVSLPRHSKRSTAKAFCHPLSKHLTPFVKTSRHNTRLGRVFHWIPHK